MTEKPDAINSCSNNPLAAILAVTLGETRACEAAEALLARYGTLGTILSETEEELCNCGKFNTSTAILIKLLGYLNSRRVTDSFELGRSYGEVEMREYVRALFYGISVETVYMILLDDKDRVIGCEYMGEGTVNASDVYPRKLLECAVKKKAKSVILAHNHPKGMPEPSKEDISTTKRLCGIFATARIRLLSHYIVADGETGKIDAGIFFE